jgi:hypothetical protein
MGMTKLTKVFKNSSLAGIAVFAIASSAFGAVSDSDPMTMIPFGATLTQLQDIKVAANENLVTLGTYKTGARTVTCILSAQDRVGFGRDIRAVENGELKNYSVAGVLSTPDSLNAQVGLELNSDILRDLICYPADSTSNTGWSQVTPTIGEFREITKNKFRLNLR